MQEESHDLQILLIVNRQEASQGFTRTITLPSGQQVSVQVAPSTPTAEKVSLGDQNASSKDGIATAVPTANAYKYKTESTEETLPPSSSKGKEGGRGGQLSTFEYRLIIEAIITGAILGALLMGLGLAMANRLPASLAISASITGTLLAVIIGSWDTLSKNFVQPFVKRWQNPRARITTVLMLLLVAGTLFWQTVGVADPYLRIANPALADTLNDGQNNNYWPDGLSVGTLNTGDNCSFKGGAYHITTATSNHYFFCSEGATDFDNFVYNVQMTIVHGDCGGIVFRINPASVKGYKFRVCQDKSFDFSRINSPTDTQSLLPTNTLKCLKDLRTDSPFTVGVVARGSNFEFHITSQSHSCEDAVDRAFDASDHTFQQGQIGVFAEEVSNKTEVVFNNLNVWTF